MFIDLHCSDDKKLPEMQILTDSIANRSAGNLYLEGIDQQT